MERKYIKQRLINGNNQFKAGIAGNFVKKEIFQQLVEGQKPYALIVSCSDSRVIPEEIFSCGPGELFVIRTAGNVINQGELASIEYGIKHLNIQFVLILAHTHCGAVHAAMNNEKGEYLSPILSNIARSVNGLFSEKEVAIANANAQVKYLKEKFPLYEGTISSAIYDIETNQVTIF